MTDFVTSETAFIWRCPLCPLDQKPLQNRSGSAVCAQGHRFDLAKEGYLNLLPVQHRHSKAPGDSAEMVRGRQAFLASGAYQPLVDGLWQQLAPLIVENGSQMTALDCGCGEGYYLSSLQKKAESINKPMQWLGLDISKLAVKKAAKQVPKGFSSVASSFHIPLSNQSVDLVTRIFAPADHSEIYRVIKSGGWFLDVAPGPKHLFELKQAVYNQVREHQLPPIWDEWTLEREASISFVFSLSHSEQVNNLLMMTPFHWKISAENRSQLLALGQWEITADFCVRLYKKQ